MTVVHVCKVTGIAGAEQHLLTLLPALAARGARATMIALDEPSRLASEFCDALGARGIPVETMRIAHDVDPWLVGRLAHRIAALAPDVVHTHLIHADLYGHRAARRAGIRAWVSSRHDNNPFRRGKLVRALNTRAMKDVGRIIAISDAVARFVVDVEGADPARVETIRYGLDVPALDLHDRAAARREWALPDNAPVVGVVGRLVEQKGLDVLIDALPAVRQRHPRTRAVVVGDGPLAAPLRERAERAGLRDAVTFMGWRRDVRSLLPAMDVVVMPSRWEGLGLAALEAMAAGRPIVASRVDALPELITHGESGLLVPPGDARALAGAVTTLLDEPARAAALGAAARARVSERFTIERMVQSTEAVYARVMAEAHTGRSTGATARAESAR